MWGVFDFGDSKGLVANNLIVNCTTPFVNCEYLSRNTKNAVINDSGDGVGSEAVLSNLITSEHIESVNVGDVDYLVPKSSSIVSEIAALSLIGIVEYKNNVSLVSGSNKSVYELSGEMLSTDIWGGHGFKFDQITGYNILVGGIQASKDKFGFGTYSTLLNIMTITQTGDIVRRTNESAVSDVAFNPAGDRFAIAIIGNGFEIWYLDEGVLTNELTVTFADDNDLDSPRSINFNNDGTKIVISCYASDKTITYNYSQSTPSVTKSNEISIPLSHSAVFSPNGQYVAACPLDDDVYILDSSLNIITSLIGSANSGVVEAQEMAWNPVFTNLILGCAKGNDVITLYKLTGDVLELIDSFTESWIDIPHNISWSPDGVHFAVTLYGGDGVGLFKVINDNIVFISRMNNSVRYKETRGVGWHPNGAIFGVSTYADNGSSNIISFGFSDNEGGIAIGAKGLSRDNIFDVLGYNSSIIIGLSTGI